MARKPQGNDRAQAKAIYEGVCDIAIANNYYMGKMMTNDKKPEQKKCVHMGSEELKTKTVANGYQ